MRRVMSKETALTAAWIVALGSSLAVLFIGEVLGQAPCNLCWFQRAFMFPLAVVLGLGLWWDDHRVGRYGVALALGGAAIALWHLGLYIGLLRSVSNPALRPVRPAPMTIRSSSASQSHFCRWSPLG